MAKAKGSHLRQAEGEDDYASPPHILTTLKGTVVPSSLITGWKAWCAHTDYGVKRVTADMELDPVADFATLPERGVQAVVLFHKEGRTVLSGRDLYWCAADPLDPHQVTFGATNDRSAVPEGAVVRVGSTIDDATFYLIHDEIEAETGPILRTLPKEEIDALIDAGYVKPANVAAKIARGLR